MFAGSVIGVFLLVIAIEAVRRAGREYDRYITRKALSGDMNGVVAARVDNGNKVNVGDAESSMPSLEASCGPVR